MPNFKELFLLDPEVVFLNHGSFGATPRAVFESYQRWQMRLERQPVLFLGREHDELLRGSREALADYVHAQADDLVYIPNATHGVNIVARSLALGPGDEILASDHEYGACDFTWEFLCAKTGATYVRREIPLPLNIEDRSWERDVVDRFWGGVTPRTRAIFLSHITSSTALRLPVEEVCKRARERGILTLIDGAHALGQIPLDLDALGADFYTANCHKWALSPKGAAFLHARREAQHLIEPLVVSWGYHPGGSGMPSTGSRYLDLLQWTGTNDPAAFLAVPDALEFMEAHAWELVRRDCHELLMGGLGRISELTGLPPAYPLESDLFIQMGIAPLPATADLVSLKARLYDEFRIEVPLVEWQGQKLIRISVQAYNDAEDIDILLRALKTLLPEAVSSTAT
jgi:isopenicillin-N epimerase